MKTKKTLAVILAFVMLVMPLAVSSFAAGTALVTGPVKTAYTDVEYFNPIGIVINDGSKEVAYLPGDEDFIFSPALNDQLTVETTQVTIYYKNAYVGTVDIQVSHVLGELVAIDNGHGKYCLGCGTLHEFEPHTITNWVPNDDGGIFTLQTQTGKCDICDAEITETIPNSDKFNSLFNEGLLTETEGLIVNYFYSIVVTLVQMLIGIK